MVGPFYQGYLDAANALRLATACFKQQKDSTFSSSLSLSLSISLSH